MIQLIKNYLALRRIKSLNLQGKKILIISGAGISKEAGIETFREGGV